MERETVYLNVKTRRITLMTEKILFIYKNGIKYVQKDQNVEPEYDIVKIFLIYLHILFAKLKIKS